MAEELHYPFSDAAAAVADRALQSDLTSEVTARTNADTTLTTAVNARALASDLTSLTAVVATKETPAGAQAKADQVKSDLLGGAPAAALDTLVELGTRLVADDDAIAALVTSVATKATSAALATEVTDRTNADTALTASITALQKVYVGAAAPADHTLVWIDTTT